MTGSSAMHHQRRRQQHLQDTALDEEKKQQHQQQQGGGAAALARDEEEALIPSPPPARGRGMATTTASHHNNNGGLYGFLRKWLTWRAMLLVKILGLLLITFVGGGSLAHRHGPASSPSSSSPSNAASILPPSASSPEAPPLSRWGKSYKLLQDGLHHLRHSWGEKAGPRQAPPGKVSVVDSETMPVRCALPSSKKAAAHSSFSSSSSSSHFFLGGQHFDRIPAPDPSSLHPRGVVISASGTVPRLAAGAYITAYLVRKVFHSTLPIEIFYVSEREVFDPKLKEQLEDLGNVRVLDLIAVLNDKFGEEVARAASEAAAASAAAAETGEVATDKTIASTVMNDGNLGYLLPSIEQVASYAAKPYGVLASSFLENILFDAGAIPFLDPNEFFSLEDYVDLGFMEFRDYVPSEERKWDWIPEEFCVDTDAVLDYYQGTEGDSSCVLFDKARNWDALLVTAILNGPLQHITYHKLNGDKDTWIMAIAYTLGAEGKVSPLKPLHTVPGFLFCDYEGNHMARKVHGQLQMLKVDADKKEEDDEDEEQRQQQEQQQGILVPLYFNNQLFNFSQWKWNKGWTYVGTYDDYGSLYNPPTSLSPDCRPVSVDYLDPLTAVMEKSFDGVVEALQAIGSTHCGCRDDWPSACVTFIY